MSGSDAQPAFIFQLTLAHRFLNRFRAAEVLDVATEPDRISDYFDFMEAFFQACWHIKDWIRNDEVLDPKLREAIWEEVKECEPILITADLANGTKHLVLSPDRQWRGARAERTEVTSSVAGKGQLATTIVLKDGRRLSAEHAARSALEAWNDILKRHGLFHLGDYSAA